MKSQGFVFETRGSLVYFAAEGTEAPPEAFWETFLGQVKTLTEEGEVRVFADARRGTGHPTPEQKEDLKKFQADKVQASLITDSMVIRGIILSLKWMNYKVNAFPGSKMDQAMEFLKCTPEEQAWLRQQMGV